MKRGTKIILSAALAVLLAGSAVAALGWVVATTPGTRWFLSSVAPLSGVGFSAARIEGKLMDRLLLTGVRVGLAEQKLEIDTLELRWNPLLLPAGRVSVRELTLKGVRIQDDSPLEKKQTMPAWPRVSGPARLLSGKIERLRVTDLSYRRLQDPPVLASRIVGSVTWRGSTLSLADLEVVSPSGNLSGTFAAGFNRPSLTADLALVPALPVARMERFSLLVRPGSGALPGQFVGSVTVSGQTGTQKLMELKGEVAMARQAFDLRRLRLTAPGRSGLVTADGSLEYTGLEPVMSLQVQATGLDLAPELNLPTDLSGTLLFAGTLESYRGKLTLANQAKGWQAAALSTPYQGNREGVKLAPFTGFVMGGALAGNLDLDWRRGVALRGALTGRDLDPGRIDPQWKGVANFNLAGQLAWSEQGPLTGRVDGALLDSTLHGKALTGALRAHFAGEDLSIARLTLQGEGFDLRASGQLNQRLNLAARISDFSRLVPGAAGTLSGAGWMRLRAGQLSGALTGTGSRLAYGDTRVAGAQLSFRLDEGANDPLHVAASLRDLVYGPYQAHAVTLGADGTLARHTVNATLASARARAQLKLSAGYGSGLWKGEIDSLAGRDANGPWQLTAPAAFAVSADKLTLAPLSITAGGSERLEIGADLALAPLTGTVRAQWTGLNLARANPYLKDLQMAGKTGGSVRLGFLSGKRVTLAGSAESRGSFTSKGQSFTIARSRVTFDGGDKGLQVALELALADGGALKGNFSSPVPFTLALPAGGDLTAESTGLDLALIQPWLPDGTRLSGHLSGRARGMLLPEGRFQLSGDAALSRGTLHQERPDGAIDLAFSAATASWGWREQALAGTLSLTLADHGRVRSEFQLPLPARFPVAFNQQGALRGSLTGQVQEKGIITALFPELVRESSGELEANLKLAGTWEAPLVSGTLGLAKAGAYLPAAGIRLKEIRVAARLEKNLIRIDSFRAVSGTGHIEGSALLTLSGWRLVGYRGTLRGENFQTVHTPEFRMQSTPDLSFEGTADKLTLRGELRLPELRIVGTQSSAAVAPSGDVVREGRVATAATPSDSPLALDVSVRVVLGERVFVKVAGIDAQLDGAVQLSLSSLDRITSAGAIRVVKGSYRTYGVNLRIDRGRLFFAGGPLDSPALDVLALRTVGEVRAGVQVSGTLQRPITKLYSEPAMPDVDVLAYIVLGHPVGSSGEQASLLTQAAGALFTSKQATVLQEQIRDRLGLSTLEVQDGVGGGSGFMGYKPLQVTAPGAIPADQQAGITETVLTVGKYLTPKLYVSYGKSLFTGSNLFKLRYDIFKKWQIETQAGSESGADLFYKLEFQ